MLRLARREVFRKRGAALRAVFMDHRNSATFCRVTLASFKSPPGDLVDPQAPRTLHLDSNPLSMTSAPASVSTLRTCCTDNKSHTVYARHSFPTRNSTIPFSIMNYTLWSTHKSASTTFQTAPASSTCWPTVRYRLWIAAWVGSHSEPMRL